MKRYILFLILIITAGGCWAQIPRMLQDAWYQELKANNKGLTYNPSEQEIPAATGDAINEMREAYNNKEWSKVDSLFEVVHKEVQENPNIYNWERTSLRNQMKNGENASETMNRLMGIYQLRFDAGLPDDAPYMYGKTSQWNETQRLVDYATYAGRRIDIGTQYEYLVSGIQAMEKPLNAIVLCHMMDLSLADDLLSDEEFVARYEAFTAEAHTTRDWLNDNFLTMDMQTASNMLQLLDQREMLMRNDRRLKNSINLANEAAAEEAMKNSTSLEERAQYYLNQAVKQIANREYNNAVENIQLSLQLNNDNPVAYLRLAECYTANSKVTGRVGNFLDKYSSQFAAVAAIDMLRENMHYVMSQQGRSAITTQIDQLRSYINQHPIYRQDLFMVSMGFGDTVRLGSYIKRTITVRERY